MARPGRTLCLLNGLYQGSDNMINPPGGLNGTNGSPITIRALNDGQVLIDGQFARRPVNLTGNDWWVLEGFNAKSGDRLVISFGLGTSNYVMRRVVAWDARIDRNGYPIHARGGPGLLEDVAIFGVGRYSFSASQGGTNNITLRRVWARWEGNIVQGPKNVYQMAYNNQGFVCENCLGTWSGESMPQEYDLHNPSGVVLSPTVHMTNFAVAQATTVFRGNVSNPPCANVRLFGSLGYIKAADVFATSNLTYVQDPLDCVDLRHVLLVISPFNARFGRVRGFFLESTPATNVSAQNLTSIRGAADGIGAAWNARNTSFGTSLAAVASAWTTTGPGAKLCKRWVNGQVTNEPLWPWPMNQRIKDATASAGAYNGPCPTCVGGRLQRSATDVTADIETLLGPIPSTCRRS